MQPNFNFNYLMPLRLCSEENAFDWCHCSKLGWIIATNYLAGNLQALFKRHVTVNRLFSEDGKTRKKQLAWTKLLTTDELHTFITGKQGREDNDNFYSPWGRHVVLFNIHQFQLFECLYKIACLSVYISLFHIYMDTVYIQIIIEQQLYLCTLRVTKTVFISKMIR